MNKIVAKFFPFMLLIASFCVACVQEELPMSFPDPDITFKHDPFNVPTVVADSIAVPITANLPWRVKTSTSWITLLTRNGLESGDLYISVLENKEIESREGSITLWVTDDYERTLRIVQLGRGKQILFSREDIQFLNKGGEEVITVTANVEWEVKSFPKWIKLVRDEEDLTVVAAPNLTAQNLEGAIVLKEVDGDKEVLIRLTQEAVGEIIALEKRILEINDLEQTIEIYFTTNVAFETITASPWITVISASSPTVGTAQRNRITIKVSAVTDGATRTGKLIVRGTSSSASDELTITQKGSGDIAIANKDLSAKPFQTEVEADITCEASWSYAFTGGKPSWITHVSDDSPITGSRKVIFTLEENVEDRERSVEVKITSGNNSETITINQDATSSASDLEALTEFFAVANGANWTSKWILEQPFTNASAWPGVTFANGRVTQINFSTSDNQIKGDIAALTRLTKLTLLKFKHQQIISIPASIGRLRELSVFWVVESALTGSLPEGMKKLTKLTEFNCSNHPTTTPAGKKNEITGTLDNLASLSGLTNLKTYCNKLSGSLPEIQFNGNTPITWPMMKIFLVYANEISGPIPYGYGVIMAKNNGGWETTAISFNIKENRFTGTVPQDLKDLTKWYPSKKEGSILSGNIGLSE